MPEVMLMLCNKKQPEQIWGLSPAHLNQRDVPLMGTEKPPRGRANNVNNATSYSKLSVPLSRTRYSDRAPTLRCIGRFRRGSSRRLPIGSQLFDSSRSGSMLNQFDSQSTFMQVDRATLGRFYFSPRWSPPVVDFAKNWYSCIRVCVTEDYFSQNPHRWRVGEKLS